MILINEGRASRAQASRVIPCTSEPKSRAHTRRLPMCPNLGTAGSQFLGLLGNLFLGTLLGNQPCLGTWEPNSQPCAVRIWLLRGILLEKETLPGNPVPNLARRADLAAPTCSGTFTMAEDPKLTLLGKNVLKSCDSQELKTFAHGFPVLGTAGSQAPILHVPSSRN